MWFLINVVFCFVIVCCDGWCRTLLVSVIVNVDFVFCRWNNNSITDCQRENRMVDFQNSITRFANFPLYFSFVTRSKFWIALLDMCALQQFLIDRLALFFWLSLCIVQIKQRIRSGKSFVCFRKTFIVDNLCLINSACMPCALYAR